MVRLYLQERQVDVHLSGSVVPDPKFTFHAFAGDEFLQARGSLTITRDDTDISTTIFVDRRHLDELINRLMQMKARIDVLEKVNK